MSACVSALINSMNRVRNRYVRFWCNNFSSLIESRSMIELHNGRFLYGAFSYFFNIFISCIEYQSRVRLNEFSKHQFVISIFIAISMFFFAISMYPFFLSLTLVCCSSDLSHKYFSTQNISASL